MVTPTADHANNYLRSQSVWQQLMDEFRANCPGEDTLSLVSTLAGLALENVASAHGRTLSEEMDEAALRDKDHTDCAALYGFVMGYRKALAEVAATIPMHQVSGD